MLFNVKNIVIDTANFDSLRVGFSFQETWTYFTSVWVLLYRIMFFYSSKSLSAFIKLAVFDMYFCYSLLFVFLCFLLIFSFFIRKAVTKKRLLLYSFFFIFFIYTWFFCVNLYLFFEKAPTTSVYSAIEHNYFQLYLKNVAPYFILAPYIVAVYKSKYKYPLNSYTSNINSWFFYLAPILFFIWSDGSYKSITFLMGELLVLYYFSLENLKKNKPYIALKNVVSLLIAVIVLLYDFTALAGHLGFVKVLDFLLLVWVLVWFRVIDEKILHKHPPIVLVYLGFVKPWLLLTFLSIYSFSFTYSTVVVGALSIYFIFFVPNNTSKHIQYAPTKAFERARKITMFEPAPDAVPPEDAIERLPFNTNAFRFIYCFCNFTNYFLLFLAVISPKTFNIGVWFSTIIFCLFTWLASHTITVVSNTLKNNDLLDWRGMFLAVHEHHWPAKHTIYAFAFYAAITASLFISVLNHLLFNVQVSLSFVFIICITATQYLLTAERVYSIWSEIITYYQFSFYDLWYDGLWAYMSPFLRDYVYWKPITPDDYVEIPPFAFELRGKASTRFFIYFYFSFLIIITLVILGLFTSVSLVVFAVSIELVFYYAFFKLYTKLLPDDFEGEELYISDFVYFEFSTYLAYGLGLFCVTWYYFL